MEKQIEQMENKIINKIKEKYNVDHEMDIYEAYTNYGDHYGEEWDLPLYDMITDFSQGVLNEHGEEMLYEGLQSWYNNF